MLAHERADSNPALCTRQAGCPSTCGAGGSCFSCPSTVQISTLAGSKDDVNDSPTINGFDCDGRCQTPYPTAGGVAYVDVWGTSQTINPYHRPAWTYNGARGGGTQIAATTVSHEAGHNFGLGHDGITSSGAGISGGEGYLTSLTGQDGTKWGATMGAAFGADVTQWSNGDYAGANNQQDDKAMLAARLGYISNPVASVPDPTDNGWPSLSIDGSSNVANGVIKESGAAGTHTYTVTALGAITGTLTAKTQYSSLQTTEKSITLVFRVTVVSSAGATVCDQTASGNAAPVITCPLNSLPADTYTVSIRGGPAAEPFSGDANVPLFSDYGNLGSYEVGFIFVLDALLSSPSLPLFFFSSFFLLSSKSLGRIDGSTKTPCLSLS
eukprot:m.305097 g.305097  ORF g.305097 m.305097 type:complete len:382 (+) comp27337_c0_seq22:59-1204(+)